MGLNLSKTIVKLLSANPEQKFTAREIAKWIFETFPAECHEKKKNSTFIKTDTDLLYQIVAEIGSQRPMLQKNNPEIKTTEGRPRQYYWTAKSDQAEVSEAEEIASDYKSSLRPHCSRRVIYILCCLPTCGLNFVFIQSELTKGNRQTSMDQGATSGSTQTS